MSDTQGFGIRRFAIGSVKLGRVAGVGIAILFGIDALTDLPTGEVSLAGEFAGVGIGITAVVVFSLSLYFLGCGPSE